MGAAAPSSHISSADYRHSHWHEHEDEYSLGRTRAIAESINDRFTNNLTLIHLARSQPAQNPIPSPTVVSALHNYPACCYCPTPLVLAVVYGIQHKYDATDAVTQAVRSCADRDHIQGAPQGRPSR